MNIAQIEKDITEKNNKWSKYYTKTNLWMGGIFLSKKSRERREKHKASKPDEYFSNGIIEMARFGKNTIIRNNSTPAQHAEWMDLLYKEYPSKYREIEDDILSFKEKVLQCDPFNLLMYVRSVVLFSQMNISSEIDYSSAANAVLRAQEYIQSIIISSIPTNGTAVSHDSEETLFSQIIVDFEKIYDEIQTFYQYWGAYIKRTTDMPDERLKEIVEAQYMYWVRGNRYQIFELDPIKSLLPPHNEILQRLFGVSSDEVINGLDKLRYSLSQGFADAIMNFGEEFMSYESAVDSGMDPESAMDAVRDRTTKIAGEVFGSDLIDVKKVTGWDDRFIGILSANIGEYPDFWSENEFAGWPIACLPITRRPFIYLNGRSYAFLYYALFDNIYRIIQKEIIQREKFYLDIWKDKQACASEQMVCELFLRLLPGAKAFVGNYYPVKNSTKQMNENDILLIYQKYLFVIEVKAGSFPSTPPITDFNAHVDAYHKLAEVADSQCSRTIEYIKKHEISQFYDREKNPVFQLPAYCSFDDVFTFSVTIDNFNEFAAKAEKLSIISLKEKTIVISVDDLLTYAEYFKSPIWFLHYLKQRKSALSIPQFQMNDELDHLGLYIDRNLYTHNSSQYDDFKNVALRGFRQSLDEYFSWLYTMPSKAVKPIQEIPKVLSEMIAYLDCNVSPENISLAHFLLDLSSDAKDEFSTHITYAIKRQREILNQIPIIAFGEIKYCVFVSVPGIKNITREEQLDYAYAATSRNEDIPVMLISLEYSSSGLLTSATGKKCLFEDVPEDDRTRIRMLGRKKAKDWVILAMRSRKVGRNDYCPCGSGKKYKHCCGNM